ncbi:putative holin-like toxin [Paenibacillus tritici]|nr:putative holin-like toxin [Paenibacillus tritici]
MFGMFIIALLNYLNKK